MIASPSNIAIVLLAAGASKRMGKPKQLLKWGESTLLGQAIQTASKVNAKELIVVLGAHFEIIQPAIKYSQVTQLYNSSWEKGLGTSIAFAVNYLIESESTVDGVLITLCDQPLITTDYLKLLVSSFEPNKQFIISTSYEIGKTGVPALFDKAYFEELNTLYDDQGAQLLIKKHKTHVLSLRPPKKNMDLDTTADYTQLYHSHFKK